MSETRSSTPIRICMVTPSYFPIVGGMETQIERLIPHLRNHRVDAWVLTRQTPDTVAYEQRDGTAIYRARIAGGPGLRSMSFTIAGAATMMRRRKHVDLIHAHGIMSPTTLAVLSGTALRVPTVVTLHATYELEHLMGKPLGASRLRAFRRSVARFVSISGDITDLLTRHGIPPERINSIPNGIDTQAFAPASEPEKARLRDALGVPQDMPVVAFVGRLHPVKQVDVLLRSWSKLTGGLLLILGDGAERNRLELLATELEIGERVRFLGMVSNVGDYLRVADGFVLPSASEGFSVALLEAMAAGAVPVATAVGGAEELIDDTRNGLLVAPGNEFQLASALGRVLCDQDWAVRAATCARETVVERYDLDVVARQLSALYRETLGLS